MPRITVEAVHADGEPRRWTLSERIAADNLVSDHYADHLIKRLSWATADAEAIESETSDGQIRAAAEPDRRGGREMTRARVL